MAFACSTENIAPNLSEQVALNFNKNAFTNARVGTGYTACGTPETHKLMAGQHIPVGEVTVFNEGDVMYVTVSIEKGEGFDNGDWFITKIHGFFGQVETDFATKGKKGMRNPAPGQFPISETIVLDYGNANQEFTYELAISDFLRDLGEFDVAIHAEVVRVENIREEGGVMVADIKQKEGAWAGNKLFNPSGTGNWATYMSYSIQPCAVACTDEWKRNESYFDDTTTGIENEETVESGEFIIKDVGVVEFKRVRTNAGGNNRRYTITIDYYILPELIGKGYSFQEFTAYTTGRLENNGDFIATKTIGGDEDEPHTSGQIVLEYTLTDAGGNQGQNNTYWQGFVAKLNGMCNP